MSRRLVGSLSVLLLFLLLCPVSQGAAQAAPLSTAPDTTYIEFVLDASISMTARIGRDTRLAIAKSVMEGLIRDLPDDPSLYVALRIYGAELDPALSACDDSVLVQPFAPVREARSNMIARVNSMQARGMTPIAKSLELAAADFPIKQGARNIVILITDGEESCGGDPCAVSARLQQQGFFLKPYVVGFALTDKQAKLVECIGQFYQASDTESLTRALGAVVKQAIQPATIEVKALAAGADVTEQAVITVKATDGQLVAASLSAAAPKRVRAVVEEGVYYVSGELAHEGMVLLSGEVRVSATPGQVSPVTIDFGSLEGRVTLQAYASGMDVTPEVTVQIMRGGATVRAALSGAPPSAVLQAGVYTFVVTHARYPSLQATVAATVEPGATTPVVVDLGQLPASIEARVTFMGRSVSGSCNVTVSNGAMSGALTLNAATDAFHGSLQPGSYDVRVSYAGLVRVDKTVPGVALAEGETTRVSIDLGDLLGVVRVRVVVGSADVAAQSDVTVSGIPGKLTLPLVGSVREGIVAPGGYVTGAVYRGIASDPAEAYVQAGKVTEIEIEVRVPGKVLIIPTVGGKPTTTAGIQAVLQQYGTTVATFTPLADVLEFSADPGAYRVIASTSRPYQQEEIIDDVAVISGATVTLRVDFKQGNTLRVRVTSEGKAFSDANLFAYPAGGAGDHVALDQLAAGTWQAVLSNGTYDLVVEPKVSGMKTQRVTDIQLSGGGLTEKTIDMSGTGLLRVNLTSDGRAFANASVAVYFDGSDNWTWMDGVGHGTWELRVPEGVHEIRVQPRIEGMNEKRVTDVAVAGGSTVVKDIHIGGTGLLRVNLTSDGKAFADADVAVYFDGSDNWTWMDEITRGTWELKVAEGVHEIRILPRIDGMPEKRVADVAVAGGATVVKDIHIGGTGLLRVNLTSDNKVFADADVALYFNGSDDWTWMEWAGRGTWELKVAEGVHEVRIYPRVDGMPEKRVTDVSVAGGATVVRDIAMGSTGLLRVNLVMDGRLFTDAYVYVYYYGGDDWASVNQVSRGVWEVRVPEGAHTVYVEPYAEGVPSRRVTGVEVAGGSTVTKTIDIGGLVTLRVLVTAGGKAVSDVEVDVYDEYGEWIGSASEVAAGRFELKVVPGTYRVEAHPWLDGYAPAEADSVLAREGSVAVEVRLTLPKY